MNKKKKKEGDMRYTLNCQLLRIQTFQSLFNRSHLRVIEHIPNNVLHFIFYFHPHTHRNPWKNYKRKLKK